jgi:putative transposase
MHEQAYTHTNNCVFSLTYHMVLVTKRRQPVLTAAMLEAAERILRERCATRGGRLVEFGGEADHLHMLVSLPPTAMLADFANAAKTSTSRLLRRDHPKLKRIGPALWSPSYFVCSCGGASLETVREYVRAQERPDL